MTGPPPTPGTHVCDVKPIGDTDFLIRIAAVSMPVGFDSV
jgi:hypothetical protein